MKTKIFNLIFAGLILCGIVLNGCSKNDSIQDLNQNPQLLTAKSNSDLTATKSILNTDLVISYARDNGTDITAQFKDFTFNFTGAPPSGPAHVWNDLLAQTGTWYYKEEGATVFEIKYPTNVFQQLEFLNRQWIIGESSSAFIRLYSNDGDEVKFTTK